MPEFPDTSESLILQVRDAADHVAWQRFEQIYRPVIFRIARAKGLQHADAQDLVQQVLLSVAQAIPQYEQRADGPPFRNWLSRITRNAIVRALSRGPREKATGGAQIVDVMCEVPDSGSEIESMIDIEYRREIYARAAAIVRRDVTETTWLAFEMTILRSWSVDRAANYLSVSTGSIYAARSRVIRRLRDRVRLLESDDTNAVST